MATIDQELALDLAFNGQPFVQVGPANDTTLDLAFLGQPFVSTALVVVPTVTEIASAADAPAATAVMLVSVTEAGTAVDSSTGVTTTSASQNESATAADSVDGARTLAASATESGNPSDNYNPSGTGSHQYWRWTFSRWNGSSAEVNGAGLFLTTSGSNSPYNSSNIALSKSASASSVDPTSTVAGAFDANVGTGWKSLSGAAAPQWLEVNLGSGNLGSVVQYAITNEFNGDYDWVLQYSDDNSTWTTAHVQTNTVWPGFQYTLFFNVPVGSTYLGAVTEAATAVESVDATASTATSASQTDGATASDSESVIANFVSSVTEAGSSADQSSVTTSAVASSTESGAATDSSSNTAQLIASQVDSASASESFSSSVIIAVSVAETSTAIESVNGGRILVSSVVESSTANDVVAGTNQSIASAVETANADDSKNGTTPKGGKNTKAKITEAGSANATQAAGRNSLVFMTEALVARDSCDATYVSPLKLVSIVESGAAVDQTSPAVNFAVVEQENSTAAVTSSASYIGNVIVASEATPATDQVTVALNTSVSVEEDAFTNEVNDGVLLAVGETFEPANSNDTYSTTVNWAVDVTDGGVANDTSTVTMVWKVSAQESSNARETLLASTITPVPSFIFEAVAADQIADAAIIRNADIAEPTDYLTEAIDACGFDQGLGQEEIASADEGSSCTVDRAITMQEFAQAAESCGATAVLKAVMNEGGNGIEASDAIRSAILFKSNFYELNFAKTIKRDVDFTNVEARALEFTPAIVQWSTTMQSIAARSSNFSGKVVVRLVPFTEPN